MKYYFDVLPQALPVTNRKERGDSFSVRFQMYFFKMGKNNFFCFCDGGKIFDSDKGKKSVVMDNSL